VWRPLPGTREAFSPAFANVARRTSGSLDFDALELTTYVAGVREDAGSESEAAFTYRAIGGMSAPQIRAARSGAISAHGRLRCVTNFGCVAHTAGALCHRRRVPRRRSV